MEGRCGREAEGRMPAWLLRWSCCVTPLGFEKPGRDDGGEENAWLCGFWHPTTGSESRLCHPSMRDLGTLAKFLHATGIMCAGLYLMRRRSGYNEMTLLKIYWCKCQSHLKHTILSNIETGIWPNIEPSRPISWSSREGLLKGKPTGDAPEAHAASSLTLWDWNIFKSFQNTKAWQIVFLKEVIPWALLPRCHCHFCHWEAGSMFPPLLQAARAFVTVSTNGIQRMWHYVAFKVRHRNDVRSWNPVVIVQRN